MDWRYLAPTRSAFEGATGLGGTEYYQEACAGGALNNPYPDFPNFPDNKPPVPNGADYVYGLNGKTIDLRFMGWQVHVEHCGGLPGLHNDEIVAAFKKLIDAGYFQNKYPSVQHIFLVQPYATVIDLNGRWNAPGALQPVAISTGSFPSFTVGMSSSYYSRADGLGTIVDSSNIKVNYPGYPTPDYTGILQPPNTISWSDGTFWTKV